MNCLLLLDLAQHYLVKAGISVLRRLKKTDNNRIARFDPIYFSNISIFINQHPSFLALLDKLFF